MKLSIIVPVYNVEQYVNKCIMSIINQETNYAFELVIINDGTKDGSMNVINDIINKNYSNIYIVVINQQNKGLGEARNVGLRKSSGEYVWFVDSDDFITPTAVNIVLSNIKKNPADCYIYDLYSVDEKTGQRQVYRKMNVSNVHCSGAEYMISGNPLTPVQRLIIRRSLLEKKSLFFTPNIYHHYCPLKSINNSLKHA